MVSRDNDGQQGLPQCIAHRGFSTSYPENTMAAFRAAVKAGAHAIEMDLQLTQDQVVVISHDPTLKSQFGRQETISDLNWQDIQDLRTTKEPHEPMPRLVDVLAFLSQPEAQHIWVILEIKVGDNAERIMQVVSRLLDKSTPSPVKPWSERIVFTLVPKSYITLARRYFPTHEIAHTGVSPFYMRSLFPVPNVSFNIALPILLFPGGTYLISRIRKKYEKPVYAWVVNDEATMLWCIRRGLDGVLCDDPEKYLAVCRRFDETARESWFAIGLKARWNALVAVVLMLRKAWEMREVLRSV